MRSRSVTLKAQSQDVASEARGHLPLVIAQYSRENREVARFCIASVGGCHAHHNNRKTNHVQSRLFAGFSRRWAGSSRLLNYSDSDL
jgi:hypothetical protein